MGWGPGGRNGSCDEREGGCVNGIKSALNSTTDPFWRAH